MEAVAGRGGERTALGGGLGGVDEDNEVDDDAEEEEECDEGE